MLTATNIFVQYGDRVLLDHITLVIKNRDKVGLVGRNGAGKSTLLKILASEITPHEGTITMPTEGTMAFLHQEIEIEQDKTVIEETMTAFSALEELNAKIEELNHQISTRTDYESQEYLDILQEFSDLNEQFALLGGESSEGDAIKVLSGLGFKQKDHLRKIEEFSGGWQMRVVLAKMLLKKPDYLLLDEPTNHLDIESIIWLEKFLKAYSGSIIIISHDQQFLDNCTNRTVEIELGRVQDYSAAYTEYLELRKERREKMVSAFENQQKVIAQREKTINRFMAKATKTKMAQSMKKQLDKMDRIEVESEDVSALKLKFPPAPRSGQIVVEGKNVTKHYGKLEVLNNIDLSIERQQRIAFVGQNGQGKTTLAKILVGQLEKTNGDIELGHNVTVGYYAQNQAETLDRNRTLLEVMEDHSPPEMRTKLRNILGAFMFSGEDAEKKVSVLSGGERARLALACLLLRPFNLLVLDEPTNHLDIITKEILRKAIDEYDGTLIVVSHDRHFLAGLSDRTIEFRDGQLYEYLGDVNYFLKKRELDTMREVETHKTQNKTNTPARKNEPSKKEISPEQKKLEKSIQNVERKIERVEKNIKSLERDMAVPGFYEGDTSENILNKHKEAKEELAKHYERWEGEQAQLEKIG